MAGVEVEVQSQLIKIVQDLENIKKSAQDVSNSLKGTGENVGRSVDDQTKKVTNSLEQLKNFGRRVADQLKQDFLAMGSVASLGAGLKLSSQFSGSIKEAVSLSDTVRKMGSVFGIARSEFGTFQSLLSRGFGDIGASSQAAANAITGLSQTGVRGQGNLLAYAKTAAQLASISGQQGQEGEIAKGAAGVITARGGNVNDPGQLASVTKEILQIRRATGKSATEITSALTGLYSKTNEQFKGTLAGGGSTTLATASLLGGPQATAFIEKYMSMDKNEREAAKSQGLGGILNSKGQIDSAAINSAIAEAKHRGRGDAQAGLRTMGLSADEAQGFIRLSEAIKSSESTINGAKTAQINLNEEYRKGMSLGDSFRANVNKVKGFLAPAIGAASQGATDLFGKTSESTGGALATTAGAGVLAAVLTGGGLRGIGGILGGEVKARAIEAATGEKVQRVEVVNFPSGFGSAAGLTGAASGIGGFLGKAGLVGAAGAAGYGIGTVANMGLDKFTQGKTAEGFEGNAVERLIFKLDQMIGGESSKAINAGNKVAVDVHIKEKPKNFQTQAKPSRSGGW